MEEKFISEIYSNNGMGVVFMSRLMHFHDYVLNGVIGMPNTKEVKEALFGVIITDLDKAYTSLKKLRLCWDDTTTPRNEKNKEIDNIYNSLVAAFKDKFQIVARLMGYDIGFIFSRKDDNFEAKAKDFISLHPIIGNELVEMAKMDRSRWQKKMIDVRNIAIEHTLDKDRELIQMLEKEKNLQTVEIMFDNCWRAIEDYLKLFVLDKIKEDGAMRLYEIHEFIKNKDSLQRFEWVFIETRAPEKLE